jgi:putative nucleotidyltransferase-like protein
MTAPMAEDGFHAIEATLKKCVAAFREAHVPTLLGGSLAIWARGGPETRHDLDFMVKPEDADRALRALEEVGMRPEKPPEGWLYKAWDADVLVDIIFQPRGLEMTDDVFSRGETREVMAISVNLMSLEDVFATKLLALDEHNCDYSALILRARSLREQIDWEDLRERTQEWPFARAFFTLAEGLEIVQEKPVVHQEDERGQRRVRVVKR